MRVLIGSLIQESNTFSPLRSNIEFFLAGCLLTDEASLTGMADTRTELGGFITECRHLQFEIVPTIAAWAASGGPLVQRDFEILTAQLFARVRAAGPVDGVLLALHGALVAEDHQDADGWILEQLRAIVGPSTPIVVTLDSHANITHRMVAAATALVGFRTYPHVDMFETGVRAAQLLDTILRTGIAPTTRVCKIPMLVPPENAQTTEGPLASLMAEISTLETHPYYLSASLFVVQPWLDVEELGCTVLVVTVGAPLLAQHDVNRLGLSLWQRRHAFHITLHAPANAVTHAQMSARGPILLVDSADSVSSGAPGDSTAILGALLEARDARPSLLTLVDPEGARTAAAASGVPLTLTIGGALDSARHRPVTVTGVARRVDVSRIVFSSGVGDGLTADLGAAAVFTVGSIQILLMEKPVPCYDPALYRLAGLEPAEAHIVVVKSPNNFRWTYRSIAREWFYVDAPGASTHRLTTLNFARAPRPLFPLDKCPWKPAEVAEAVAENLPAG